MSHTSLQNFAPLQNYEHLSSPNKYSPCNSNQSLSDNNDTDEDDDPEDTSINGYYFENSKAYTTKSKKPTSPKMKALNLNLKEFCQLRNDRIYSIDEISEISGKSNLVAFHEHEHLRKVQEILSAQRNITVQNRYNLNQKKSATNTQRQSNLSPKHQSKPLSTHQSDNDYSPPYGHPPKKPAIPLKNYKNCRIFIPAQQPQFLENRKRNPDNIDKNNFQTLLSPVTSNHSKLFNQFYNAIILDANDSSDEYLLKPSVPTNEDNFSKQNVSGKSSSIINDSLYGTKPSSPTTKSLFCSCFGKNKKKQKHKKNN